MDIATLLQNFTGEKERTAALTAENTALKNEIAALKTAAVAPSEAVAALTAKLAETEKTAAANVATSATVNSALNFTLAALGVESATVSGKDAEAVKQIVAARVAAKSAEQLASVGLSAHVSDDAGVNDGNKTVMTRAEFNGLSAVERLKFCRAGGKLTE